MMSTSLMVDTIPVPPRPILLCALNCALTFDHQGFPFSGQSTFILLCWVRWPYHRASPSSPARPLHQRVQQFLDVDPIRLCPPTASVHCNRGCVDHMALYAVCLQEAVYPETVETGLVDRNNPHRSAAGSLRSGLQPLQQ